MVQFKIAKKQKKQTNKNNTVTLEANHPFSKMAIAIAISLTNIQ